ncbi:MAG: carboxypeptidase-like regulatory domain-containing protein [Carboxylicivirga sp.]|nr:carboxypeptidase-like regulatory domain-containing protein [Carboxylicivirga sp.]MCT4645134.1 carboxypeptidase-like regulatory domain-containing protein [Carboxylicivirga sp.]
MKLSVVLLFAILIHMSGSVYSQNEKIKVREKRISLSDLLWKIQSKTDFVFAFSADKVEMYENLSVDVEGNVEEVLNAILKDTNLGFEVKNGVYVINYKKQNDVKTVLQEKVKVKGFVKDAQGQSLIGVNVIVKDANIGTVTDMDGRFNLDVPAGYNVLTFSYIGFITQDVTVIEGKEMTIVLKEEVSELGEVVATGYFNKGKTGFAGSVSTFKQEEIQKVSTGNMLNTLAILDASFRIHENNLQGSNPNAVPDFTIRGRGSFQNESTQPIFIIDGFQNTAEFVMDMDPNRIKSMSILKDAAATILYGSRAANGVVVIETIAPQPGELRVTYDFRPTIAIPDLTDYNLMNAAEKLEFEKLAGLYNGTSLEDQIKKDKEYNSKFKAI